MLTPLANGGPTEAPKNQSAPTGLAMSPRRPRRRARSAEVFERVTEVAHWLGAGLPEWKAKKQIQSKWEVRPRQAMHYLALARKRLVEAIGKPIQELQAEAYARYLAIFDDKQAKPADRVRANKGIVELLGLAAPKCLRVQGDPADSTMKPEEIRRLEALFEAIGIEQLQVIEDAIWQAEEKERWGNAQSPAVNKCGVPQAI